MPIVAYEKKKKYKQIKNQNESTQQSKWVNMWHAIINGRIFHFWPRENFIFILLSFSIFLKGSNSKNYLNLVQVNAFGENKCVGGTDSEMVSIKYEWHDVFRLFYWSRHCAGITCAAQEMSHTERVQLCVFASHVFFFGKVDNRQTERGRVTHGRKLNE